MEKRTIEISANIETGEVEIYLENWSSNQNAINVLKNVIAKLEETGGDKVTVIISDSPEKESTLADLRKPVEQWPAEGPRIKEDGICPKTGKHCDDECCPVGAVCNLDTSGKLQPCEEPAEELFYIQDGYIGNSVCWWRLGSKGRTEDLEVAQKYTREETESIIKSAKFKGFVGWPCKYINENEAARKMVIDSQYVSRKNCHTIENL